MFGLGANLGLGFLDFADHLVQNTALSVLFVSAAPSGNLPNNLAPSMFFELLGPGVTCLGADYIFLAVQQFGDLRDAYNIGRCDHHTGHQSRLVVGADVSFGAEIVLVTFLG